MQFKDISFSTPQENIDFDEDLWHQAEKQGAGETLRFWESSQVFIVMGLTGRQEMDVNLALAGKDNVPVLRRSSGGGTVVQGPGCLNFCLVLSKQKHPQLNQLHKSYEWILSRVIKALKRSGVEAFFRPLSDLAVGPDEKKFSGNAQRRGKYFILHHGTILYDFDLSLISRYLNMPKDVPEYRKGRRHNEFVANVSIDPPAFKAYLAELF
jgi:lipoate-protein ligase A